MNAPADLRVRPSAARLAAIVEELLLDFGERATTATSLREQHGRGEGLADMAMPDVVVFPQTTEEVARIVRRCNAAGVPVIALSPVAERPDGSCTRVAIVKSAKVSASGVQVTPASSVFTSATGPDADQTPLPASNVDVTAPAVAVVSAPVALLESVKVAVTVESSTSAATRSVRSSGVSSM